MAIRIVIAGSRNYNDYESYCIAVDEFLSQFSKNEIIILSGNCRGVDAMSERYAEENGLEVEIYPAEWSRYGRAAGPKRNRQMVASADMAIAFWSGSRGTESLIELANKKGIPVKVIMIQ